MGTRTITSSLDFSYDSNYLELEEKLNTINQEILGLSKKKDQIRTFRITLIFKEQITYLSSYKLIAIVETIARIAKSKNFRWVCLPLNLKQFNCLDSVREIIPNILARVPNLFIHLINEDHNNFEFNKICASTILKVSSLSSNGFDNFRLGISNGFINQCPFFPFSYFSEPFSYSIGLEPISILEGILIKNNYLETSEALELFSKSLNKKIIQVHNDYGNSSILNFVGIDSSLAPVPRTRISVGLIYELLGVSIVGHPGTLGLTSKLTQTIKSSFANTLTNPVGFNGVMFSPLEDDWLAKQSKFYNSSINSFLLLSTVCGCGLDMLPIQGETFIDSIAATIYDTLSLSERLKKPLGIRLLPIPGKTSSELTNFNHDFFSDMKILELN